MLDSVFPPSGDFIYRGSRTALWLLGLILLVKLGIALGAIFNGHYAASVADGIPVATEGDTRVRSGHWTHYGRTYQGEQ